MKTCVVYLWQNLEELFLEWELLHMKVVEKIKIRDLCSAENLVAYVGIFSWLFETTYRLSSSVKLNPWSLDRQVVPKRQ